MLFRSVKVNGANFRCLALYDLIAVEAPAHGSAVFQTLSLAPTRFSRVQDFATRPRRPEKPKLPVRQYRFSGCSHYRICAASELGAYYAQGTFRIQSARSMQLFELAAPAGRKISHIAN